MATFKQIAEGIAAQFAQVEGLRTAAFVPNTISPPTLFVHLTEAKPSTMTRGWFEVEYDVFLLTSSTSDRAGQGALEEFVSPDQCWAKFGTNNDLDLTDGTAAEMLLYRSLSVEELAAYPYYGGVFEIRVTTPGA